MVNKDMIPPHIPDCEAFESALCDYLDGACSPEARAAMAIHLSECVACAAYERDIREGMGLLQAAEPLDAPPVMVNRILLQVPAQATGWRGWLARLFEPLVQPFLQPRIVMGAMMTVLSLAMMTRCAGVPSRSLTASDLDPVRIWGAFDDRVHRTWDRTVKAYESMRVVYEVQGRVHEWRQQQEEQDRIARDEAARDALRAKDVTAKQPGGATSPKPDSALEKSAKGVEK